MRDRTEDKIKLTLIRHGITRFNKEKRYLGRTDEGLSDDGVNKIKEIKHKYKKSDLLFISPMLRCRQTADILFPNQKTYVIEEWKEIDFGRFEGKSFQELSKDQLYRQWVDSGCKGQIPDGEALEGFIKRSLAGLDKCFEICEKYKDSIDDKKKDIISATAIVHGGTIMSLLSSLTDSDYFDYQVKNEEGYILEFENRRLKNISFTGDK